MQLKYAVLSVISSVIIGYIWSKRGRLTETDYDANIRNKVVLITGGSSGIGEEIAYQLASRGAQLVLSARRENRLRAIKDKAIKLGSPKVHIIPFDFANVAESYTVVDEAVEVMGAIDYAVLNHVQAPYGPFLDRPQHQPPSYLENVFRVNVLSMIQLLLSVLPVLESNSGHIFLTSSGLGEHPYRPMTIYSSTKHALNGFFYSIQQELLARRSNVTLTVGNLGVINTDAVNGLMEESPEPLPWFLIGDVEECVGKIVDALILKPRTMNYPIIATNAFRLAWYFNPWFHELAMGSPEFMSKKDNVNN